MLLRFLYRNVKVPEGVFTFFSRTQSPLILELGS
jgi:hypothetical protein